ncbi:hypothetical protein AMAG_16696 [Allomyces macrogynus ATCC 38327]|uniref:Dynein regulatory complex protein 1/2 N-terminal domain-containing protein n=1 Tax=Allomyces macrogynus (strain ATCC 38327) TaxID=578462 RepID=A0A0L0TBM5_ALLM3|nr:hypothetical protein AMAG_16696 [Allomyces macrogynus ATCC 38327]|eukprot:KNE72213.1 hypothetical protein AMAG_16696 [Allomyces macrogynus ATCC 38327]
MADASGSSVDLAAISTRGSGPAPTTNATTTTPTSRPHSASDAADAPKPDSRESRIQARRARIDTNRHAQATRAEADAAGAAAAARRAKRDADALAPASKAAAQTAESRERMAYVKRRGIDDVSHVRIGAVNREHRRRHDEQHRAEILARKAAECDDAGGKLESRIKAAWEKSLAMSATLATPHDLHQMLVDQKVLCEQLLHAKENLLIEYHAELKRKDDEYVKELKRQADEIDQLLVRMDQQFAAFKKSLREELVHIERAHVAERADAIDANVREIERLFESRKASEQRYLDERSRRVHDHADALDELRVQDAEEYNLVKIKLETDVQVLEQQLQQMKATYQLNTEKLEYNYQVLKKRDDENSITVNQQKRRITRMTDIVNTLKSKLARQEKQFAGEHATLQDDYNRIAAQYDDLTKKFRHFQVNDEVKFQELWDMNQDAIRDLVAKVLMADAVIFHQQLGLPWDPPPVAAALGIDAHSLTSGPVRTSAAAPATDTNGDTAPVPAQTASAASTPSMSHLLLASSHSVIHAILGMLATEASFLLDDKLARLLAPLPAHERALLQLDTILKALDVHAHADLVAFLQLFLLPKFHGAAHALAASIIGQPGAQVDETEPAESMLIHPNMVTKVLMRYLRDRSAASGARPSATVPETAEGEDPAAGPAAGGAVVQDDRAAIRAHWNQTLAMLDASRFRHWETVHRGMDAYHLLLCARRDLTMEVTDLETQNLELRTLLREYMAADVNGSLQVPPSQVIMSQVQRQQQQMAQQGRGAVVGRGDAGGATGGMGR